MAWKAEIPRWKTGGTDTWPEETNGTRDSAVRGGTAGQAREKNVDQWRRLKGKIEPTTLKNYFGRGGSVLVKGGEGPSGRKSGNDKGGTRAQIFGERNMKSSTPEGQ